MSQLVTSLAQVSGSEPVCPYIDLVDCPAHYGGTIYWYRKVVYQRRIPYYKRGGRVCFLRSDLENYFNGRRVEARAEAA